MVGGLKHANRTRDLLLCTIQFFAHTIIAKLLIVMSESLSFRAHINGTRQTRYLYNKSTLYTHLLYIRIVYAHE